MIESSLVREELNINEESFCQNIGFYEDIE